MRRRGESEEFKMIKDVLIGRSCPLYRPAFPPPPALVQSCSVPPHPVLPLSTCRYALRIEMNRNEEERSRNNPTIKRSTQFSTPNVHRFSLGRLTLVVLSPSQQTPVNEKKGQKVVRKEQQKYNINQIYLLSSQRMALLPEIVLNGGETADG